MSFLNFFIKFYGLRIITQLRTKNVYISGEKKVKIIENLNELISLFSILKISLGEENYKMIKNREDFNFYFSKLFEPETDIKKKYTIIPESIKRELIEAKNKKIFSTSDLSEITYIPKKNINNWIKKGAKRKKGCGKKKCCFH